MHLLVRRPLVSRSGLSARSATPFQQRLPPQHPLDMSQSPFCRCWHRWCLSALPRSRPPPLPFKLSFFCVVLSFLSLMHAGKSPSTHIFELVSAASFAGVSVGLLVSLCCCLPSTTHSLTFFSSFQADRSTAHSRCDEFFDCNFPMCPSTSASMPWYFDVC